MTETVLTTIISSVFTFAGVVLTVALGNKKTQKNVKEHTDLTLYRITQLEKKQDKHNTLIERMYKVEEDISVLSEKVSFANNRISDLEHHTV